MKKLISFILILVLFTALFSITAFAAEDEEIYYAYSNIALAFRNENGDYIKDMPESEIFTVLKSDPRDLERVWVNWNGEEGSVIKSGITRIDYPFIANDVIEGEEAFTDIAYTNCGLNLRVAETYEFIKTIPEASKITVLGEDIFNEGRVIVVYDGEVGSVLKSGLFFIRNASYILVDIENQRISMYKDGQIIVEDYVVTGFKGIHDTPKGFFTVSSMAQNAVLRGEDYEVPVRYWMPFSNGCGLHDASWREYFGGNIYEWDGSHGCVNMHLSTVEIIYENAYVGMALIVV